MSKKQPLQKSELLTDKVVPLTASDGRPGPIQHKDSRNGKFRHTSILTREQSQKEILPKGKNSNSTGKSYPQIERKLPEIYNPISSSHKYFDTKKFEAKARFDHQQQKKKSESLYMSQKHRRISDKRSELSSANKNIKLNQLQPLKQMPKQKKVQLFKAIRSQFHNLINTSNNLSVINEGISFKAFVEKGNNGILVKQIIKKRWWWHVEEDKKKANLVWTQWFDKSVTATLSNTTLADQNICFEDYQTKNYDQNTNKQGAIKKLVDSETYTRLQNNISIHSNTYFKQNKGLNFQRIGSNQDLKMITVDNDQMIHNHVEGCLNLHSKKLLFMNFQKFMQMKQMDPFSYIPLTFYIQSRNSDSLESLLSKFDEFQLSRQTNKEQKNIWICKPGENSNRGCGIKVVNTKEKIIQQLKQRLCEGNTNRSVIIQKYMERCFLINNRKFDIRCYILLTTANGILKGYWYKDGYIRTSSVEYSLDDIDNEMIHLTNDAVQKKGDDFGKHQDSNKLSFEDFRGYLKKIGLQPNKFDESYEKMKLIAYYLIASVNSKIKRKQFTFELFGLDFMLDQSLNPVLIQANSNPCLSNHGKILGHLIHELVENVIMTAIDPIFPPPLDLVQKKKKDIISKDYFESNKFELIFTDKEKPKNKPLFSQVEQTFK